VIAYIDSSVLMRIILAAPDQLEEWDDLHGGVSSQLLKVEAFRTLDQLWHRGKLTQETLAEKAAQLNMLLPHLEMVPLTDSILERAALPLPTTLATLDSIHLATATNYRDSQPDDERPILFATHDHQLATAARSLNFDVIGVPA
jgi:predicted nucleic acid-binding protein